MLETLKSRIADLLAQGTTVIVAVLHSDKEEAANDAPIELRVNPTMSKSGMTKINELIPTLRELGEFYHTLYTSRLARALDTASVMALALDLEIETIRGLGQHANKCTDGSVVYYPGCEAEECVAWQTGGVNALYEIGGWEPDRIVLVASHRPVVGGILAHCNGVEDSDGIKAVVNDPALTKDGYLVFSVDFDGEIEHLGP